MSIKITRKGYYRVMVSGAKFSQHVDPNEAIENASEIIAADPSLVVTVLPPMIEVAVAEGAVIIPDPEAPLPVAEGGMDLVDYLLFHTTGSLQPTGEIELIEAANHWDFLSKAADSHRTDKLGTRVWGDPDADGKKDFLGVTWRGFFLLTYFRTPGAVKIT